MTVRREWASAYMLLPQNDCGLCTWATLMEFTHGALQKHLHMVLDGFSLQINKFSSTTYKDLVCHASLDWVGDAHSLILKAFGMFVWLVLHALPQSDWRPFINLEETMTSVHCHVRQSDRGCNYGRTVSPKQIEDAAWSGGAKFWKSCTREHSYTLQTFFCSWNELGSFSWI